MAKQKTIKDAAKKLPAEVRKIFIACFEASDAGDYYDGDLEAYFEMILRSLQNRTNIIKEKDKKLQQIHALSAIPTVTV